MILNYKIFIILAKQLNRTNMNHNGHKIYIGKAGTVTE